MSVSLRDIQYIIYAVGLQHFEFCSLHFELYSMCGRIVAEITILIKR
jgi:hypothetical protein